MDSQRPGDTLQTTPDSLRFISGFWLFAAVVAQWFFAACLVAHHS